MLRFLRSLDHTVTNFEKVFLAICLITMLAVNIGNVLSRFVLHQSWSTTEELSRYLFVACTLIGTSLATRHGDNLTLSLVTNFIGGKLGLKTKRLFAVIRGLLTALVFIFLAYLGMELVLQQLNSGQTSPSLGIPRWIPTLAIPVFGFLIFIRSLQYTLTEWEQAGEKS